MFEIVDYSEIYDSIMMFNKNKSVSIHQWYPFVEGYSKEFIEKILSELNYTPERVLEPFAGSGTTPLELQSKNISCMSFEVSPFMHLLSSVKLNTNYRSADFNQQLSALKENLKTVPKNIRSYQNIPFGKTVVRNENLKKWNFNDPVLNGILDIKYCINKIEENLYQNLFKICLASILLEVSNVFRNGKCLSYKDDWQSKIRYKRKDIHDIFIFKLENIIFNDILKIENESENILINNFNNLHFGDIRKNINIVDDDSIDLIITSPPYLNSRDYTDIYMLELKVLDLITNYDELKRLRRETLRSHVQVKHGDLNLLPLPTLVSYIELIENKGVSYWNNDLLNMIKGYFLDMDFLFSQFRRIMRRDKFIYFNVANSAYFGEVIKVDEIICEIAESKGFEVIEIRKARNLKSSSQQSISVKSLRESVIVLRS
jgi:DNA modification methylase